MKAVLDIRSDGTIQCLWTENLPLHEMGTLHVQRASYVEFSIDSQKWEVRMEGSNEVVFTHESRAACIAWEVDTINHKLLVA